MLNSWQAVGENIKLVAHNHKLFHFSPVQHFFMQNTDDAKPRHKCIEWNDQKKESTFGLKNNRTNKHDGSKHDTYQA